MTALTAMRNTRSQGVGLKHYPVAATTNIYKGGMVCIDASGYAVPAANDAALSNVIGVAHEDVDNSGGSNGDLNVRVELGRVHLLVATSITQAMVGDNMYVVDDQTFDDVDPGNSIRAGILMQFVSTTSGWILIAQLYDLGTIGSGDIGAGAVTAAKIGADAVTGAKIIDNAVNSEHYTDGSIDPEHFADDAVLSDKVENGLIQYKDTQLSATNLKALMGTNIEVVPAPGASKAIFPVRIALFMDHTGTDYVQVANGDQLALKYSGSNEIIEVGTEGQCTALLETSADAALYDPIDTDGFVLEENKAIDLDNNGANDLTTGSGTLSVRVWFIEVPFVAFT